MCGHLSIFSQREPIPEALAEKGVATLHHRGPDAQQVWLSRDRRVALGHARLSIIDLQGGTQPLHTPDQRVHAVVNGELYDFEREREALRGLGHTFLTQSDSEILLHLYQRYGTACVGRLRGEFAFTLWDEANDTIFAGRDRFGIKPLFYSRIGDRLYIGSEIKALLAAGVPAAWDEEQVHLLHTSRVTPPNRTLFRGVYQVPPGHFLLASGDDLKILPYWDFDYPVDEASRDTPRDDASCIEAAREALHDAVRVRLRADVPVSCYLSGGLDSCAVLGIAQQYANRPLQAYTIAFVDEGATAYNEEPIARAMAAHCGAAYTPLEVTTEILVDRFADSLWHSEIPVLNLHATAKFMLSERVRRDGNKVVLTGEGADEIFAGYANFRKDYLMARRRGADAEAGVRDLVATNAASGTILLSPETHKIPVMEQALGYTPAFLEPFAGQGADVSRLLAPALRTRYGARDPFRVLLNGIDVGRQMHGRDHVHQSMYLWSKVQLNNYILTCLGDRMEMAHSVEGRTPMLDHLLVERVVRMPVDIKIRGTTEKYLLREVARPVLTDEVYRRQKHPFVAPPIPKRATDPLDALLQDTLRSPTAQLPFYDQATVRALLDERPHADGRRRELMEPVLMTMMSLAIMQRRFGLS